MRRIKILLILSGLMWASMSPAQNTGSEGDAAAYQAAMDENSKLQEELQTLTDLKASLSETVKGQEDQLKSLDASMKAEAKSLAKRQGQGSQNLVAELKARKQALQTSIDSYQGKMAELMEQNIKLEQSLASMRQRLENLDRVRDDVDRIFIETHQKSLDQAFSAMKMQELETIQGDCGKYASDGKIQTFAKRLEAVIGMKRAYDNAVKTVGQRYDAAAVERALSALPTSGMSSVQADEVAKVRKQLQTFEPGLIAFKELASALSRRRSTISSQRDLDDELDIIMGKGNLKSRIATQVETVPYLKNKYTEYIKALKAAPSQQPAVEKEIMEQ